MNDLLKLCLFLVIVMKCTGLDCITCQGLECLKSKIPKLKCQKDYPKLPFQDDLSQEKTKQTSQYGCLALQYYTGKTLYSINQCFPVISDNCICEQLKQLMQVKQCSFSGRERQRNIWNNNIDCEKNTRDNSKTNKNEDDDRIEQKGDSEQRSKQNEKAKKEMTEKERKEKEKKIKEKEERAKKEAEKIGKEKENRIKETKISSDEKKDENSKIKEKETETGNQMETEKNIDVQNNGDYFSSVINIVSWLAGNSYQAESETIIKDSQLSMLSDTMNTIPLAENTKLIQSSPYQGTPVNSSKFEKTTAATTSNSSATKTNIVSKRPLTAAPDIIAESLSTIKLLNVSNNYISEKTTTKQSNIPTESQKATTIATTEAVSLSIANTGSSSNYYTSNISPTKQNTLVSESQKITSTASDKKTIGWSTTQSAISMGIQKATYKRETNAPSITTTILSSSNHNRSTINSTKQNDVSTNIQKGATIEIADESALSTTRATIAGYNNAPSPTKQKVMSTKTQNEAASVTLEYLPLVTTLHQHSRTGQTDTSAKTQKVATSVMAEEIALPTTKTTDADKNYVDNKKMFTKPNNKSNQTQEAISDANYYKNNTSKNISTNITGKNNSKSITKIPNSVNTVRLDKSTTVFQIVGVPTDATDGVYQENNYNQEKKDEARTSHSIRIKKDCTNPPFWLTHTFLTKENEYTSTPNYDFSETKKSFIETTQSVESKSHTSESLKTFLSSDRRDISSKWKDTTTSKKIIKPTRKPENNAFLTGTLSIPQQGIPSPEKIIAAATGKINVHEIDDTSKVANYYSKYETTSVSPHAFEQQTNISEELLPPIIIKECESAKTESSVPWNSNSDTNTPPNTDLALDNSNILKNPESLVTLPTKNTMTSSLNLNTSDFDTETKIGTRPELSWSTAEYNKIYENLLKSEISETSELYNKYDTLSKSSILEEDNFLPYTESSSVSDENVDTKFEKVVQATTDYGEIFTKNISSDLIDMASRTSTTTISLNSLNENKTVFKSETSVTWDSNSKKNALPYTEQTLDNGDILKSTLNSKSLDAFSTEDTATFSTNLNTNNYETKKKTGTGHEQSSWSMAEYSKTYENAQTSETTFGTVSNDKDDTLSLNSNVQILEENNVSFKTEPSFVTEEYVSNNFEHFTEATTESIENLTNELTSELPIMNISTNSSKEEKVVYTSEASVLSESNYVTNTSPNKEQTLENDNIYRSTPSAESLDAFSEEDTATSSTNLNTNKQETEEKSESRYEQSSWSMAEYSKIYKMALTSEITDTSVSNDKDDVISSNSNVQSLEENNLAFNTETSFVTKEYLSTNFEHVTEATTESTLNLPHDLTSELSDMFPIEDIMNISTNSSKEEKDVNTSEASVLSESNSVTNTSPNKERILENDNIYRSTPSTESLDAFSAEDTATSSTNLNTYKQENEEKSESRYEHSSWSTAEYSKIYKMALTSEITDTSVSNDKDDVISSNSNVQILEDNNLAFKTEPSFVTEEYLSTNFELVTEATTEGDANLSIDLTSKMPDIFPIEDIMDMSTNSLKQDKELYNSETLVISDSNAVTNTSPNVEQTLDNDNVYTSTSSSERLEAFSAEDTATSSTNLNTNKHDTVQKSESRYEQSSWSTAEYSKIYKIALTSEITDTSVSNDKDDVISSNSNVQILEENNLAFKTETSFVTEEYLSTNFEHVIEATTESTLNLPHDLTSELSDMFPIEDIMDMSTNSLKEEKEVYNSETSVISDSNSVTNTSPNMEQTLDNDNVYRSTSSSERLEAFSTEDTATSSTNLNTNKNNTEEKSESRYEQSSWSTAEYSKIYKIALTSEITDTSASNDKDDAISSNSNVQILEENNLAFKTEPSFVTEEYLSTNFEHVTEATTESSVNLTHDLNSELSDIFQIEDIKNISTKSSKEEKEVYNLETSVISDSNSVTNTSPNVEQTLDNDNVYRSTPSSERLDDFSAEDTATFSTNLNTNKHDTEEEAGSTYGQSSWSMAVYNKIYKIALTSEITDTSVSNDKDDVISSNSNVQILEENNLAFKTETSFVTKEYLSTNFEHVTEATTESSVNLTHDLNSELSDIFQIEDIKNISTKSSKEEKEVYNLETSVISDSNSVTNTSPNVEQTLDNDNVYRSTPSSERLDDFSAEDTATFSTNLNTIKHDTEEEAGSRYEQSSWSTAKSSKFYKIALTSEITDTSVSNDKDDVISSNSNVQILEENNLAFKTETSFVTKEYLSTNFEHVTEATTESSVNLTHDLNSELSDIFQIEDIKNISTKSSKEEKEVYNLETSVISDSNSVTNTSPNVEQTLDNDNVYRSTPSSERLDDFSAEDTATFSTNLNTIKHDTEEEAGSRYEQSSWSTAEYSKIYKMALTSEITDTSVSNDKDDVISSNSNVQILEENNLAFKTETSFVTKEYLSTNFEHVTEATTVNLPHDLTSELSDMFPIEDIMNISINSSKEEKEVYNSESSVISDSNSVTNTSPNMEQTLDNDNVYRSTPSSERLVAFFLEDAATFSTNLNTNKHDTEEEAESRSTAEYSKIYKIALTSEIADTSVSNDKDDVISSNSNVQILEENNLAFKTETSFVTKEYLSTNFEHVTEATTVNLPHDLTSELSDMFPIEDIMNISINSSKEEKEVYNSESSVISDSNSVTNTSPNMEQTLDNDNVYRSTPSSERLVAFFLEDAATFSTNLNTNKHDTEEEAESRSTAEYSKIYKIALTSEIADTSVSNDKDDVISSNSNVQILEENNLAFKTETSFVTKEYLSTNFEHVTEATTESSVNLTHDLNSELSDIFQIEDIKNISTKSSKEEKEVYNLETSVISDSNSVTNTSPNVEQTLDNDNVYRSTPSSERLDDFSAEDTATFSTNLNTIKHDTEEEAGSRYEQSSWSTAEYSKIYKMALTSEITDTSVSNDKDDVISSNSNVQILEENNLAFKTETSFVTKEYLSTNFEHVTEATTVNLPHDLTSELSDMFPIEDIMNISINSSKEEKEVYNSESSVISDSNSVTNTSPNMEQTLDNDNVYRSTPSSERLVAFFLEDAATFSTNLNTNKHDTEEEAESRSTAEYSKIYKIALTSEIADTSVSNDRDDAISSNSNLQIFEENNLAFKTEPSFVTEEYLSTNFEHVTEATTEGDANLSIDLTSELSDIFPIEDIMNISTNSSEEEKEVNNSETSVISDSNSVTNTSPNMEQTLDNDNVYRSTPSSERLVAFFLEDAATFSTNLNTNKHDTEEEAESRSTAEYSKIYKIALTSEIADTSVSNDRDDAISSNSNLQIFEENNLAFKTEPSFVTEEYLSTNFEHVTEATTEGDANLSIDLTSELSDIFPIEDIMNISTNSSEEEKEVYNSETSVISDSNSVTKTSRNVEQILDNDNIYRSTPSSEHIDAFSAEDTATFSTNQSTNNHDTEEKAGTRDEQSSWSTAEYSKILKIALTSEVTDTSVSNDKDDAISTNSNVQILEENNLALKTEPSYITEEYLSTNFEHVTEATKERIVNLTNDLSSELPDIFLIEDIMNISTNSSKEEKDVNTSEASVLSESNSVTNTSPNIEQILDNDNIYRSTPSTGSLDAFSAEDTATFSTNLNTNMHDTEEKAGTRDEQSSWSTAEYSNIHKIALTSEVTDTSVSNDKDDAISTNSNVQILEENNLAIQTEPSHVTEEYLSTNFEHVTEATTEITVNLTNNLTSNLRDIFSIEDIMNISTNSSKEEKEIYTSEASVLSESNSITNTSRNMEQTLYNDSVYRSTPSSERLDAFSAEDTATFSTSEITDTSISNDKDDAISSNSNVHFLEGNNFAFKTEPSFLTDGIAIFTNDLSSERPVEDIINNLTNSSKEVYNSESSVLPDSNYVTNTSPKIEQTLDDGDNYISTLNSESLDTFSAEEVATFRTKLNTKDYQTKKQIETLSEQLSWSMPEYSKIYENTLTSEVTDTSVSNNIDGTLSSNSNIQILEKNNIAFKTEPSFATEEYLNTNFEHVTEATTESIANLTYDLTSERPDIFPLKNIMNISTNSSKEEKEVYTSEASVLSDLNSVTNTSPNNIEQTLDNDDIYRSMPSYESLDTFSVEKTAIFSTTLNTNTFDTEEKTGTRYEQSSLSTAESSKIHENDLTSEIPGNIVSILLNNFTSEVPDIFPIRNVMNISTNSSEDKNKVYNSESSQLSDSNFVTNTPPNTELALDHGNILKNTINSESLETFSAEDTATISTNIKINYYGTEGNIETRSKQPSWSTAEYGKIHENILSPEITPTSGSNEKDEILVPKSSQIFEESNVLYKTELLFVTEIYLGLNADHVTEATAESKILTNGFTSELSDISSASDITTISSNSIIENKNVFNPEFSVLWDVNSVINTPQISDIFGSSLISERFSTSYAEDTATFLSKLDVNNFESDKQLSTMSELPVESTTKYSGSSENFVILKLTDNTIFNDMEDTHTTRRNEQDLKQEHIIFDKDSTIRVDKETNTFNYKYPFSTTINVGLNIEQPSPDTTSNLPKLNVFEHESKNLLFETWPSLKPEQSGFGNTQQPTILFEKGSILETTLEGNDIFNKDISLLSRQTAGPKIENTERLEEKAISEEMFGNRITENIENPSPSQLVEGKISTSIRVTNDDINSESFDTTSLIDIFGHSHEIQDTTMTGNGKISSIMSTIEYIKTSIENPKTTSATVEGEISGPRSITETSTLFPEEPNIASAGTDFIETISRDTKETTDRTTSTRKTPEASYVPTVDTEETSDNIWIAKTTNTILETHISANDITTTVKIFGAISSIGMTKSESETMPATATGPAVTTGQVITNLEQTTETSQKAPKISSVVTGTTEKILSTKSTTQSTTLTQKESESTSTIEVTTENSLPEFSNNCDYDMISSSLHPIPFSFIYVITLFVAILINL